MTDALKDITLTQLQNCLWKNAKAPEDLLSSKLWNKSEWYNAIKITQSLTRT